MISDPKTAVDALTLLEWMMFNRAASDNKEHHRFRTCEAAQRLGSADPAANDSRRAESALVTLLTLGLVRFVERRGFETHWASDQQVAGRMRAASRAKRDYDAAVKEADDRLMATLPEREQRRITAGRADLVLHPESRAWEVLTFARHSTGDSLRASGPEGYFRDRFRNVRRDGKRLPVLADLIEEMLGKFRITMGDPFRSELVAKLVETAKADAVALRLTEDTWPGEEQAEPRE